MSRTYDFAAIKRSIPITQGAEYLALTLTPSGNSLRAQCPACEGASERSLSLLPASNYFHCFHANVGGSVIDLVAHVRSLSIKEAAQWLSEYEETPTQPDTPPPPKKPPSGQLTALEKPPKLEADHEEISALGLNPKLAEKLGIGYAKVGLLKGHVAVPVFNTDKELVGYLGIPKGTVLKLPKNLQGGAR